MRKAGPPLSGLRLLFLGSFLTLAVLPLSRQQLRAVSQEKGSAIAVQPRLQAYGQVPLAFEANQGQTDTRADFISRGRGYTLFLKPTEVALSLPASENAEKVPGRHILPAFRKQEHAIAKQTMLGMRLAGSNPHAGKSIVEELPGKANYILGNDPAKWLANIPTYAKVGYRNVYPGVDLVYYGKGSELEYDFVVAPAADPKVIRLTFAGTDKLALDSQGNLLLHMRGGTMLQLHKPLVYQEKEGRREEVAGAFLVEGRQVRFGLGDYDTTRPVVIDPVFVFSTHLGGSRSSSGQGIAVDPQGNIYVTGDTNSADFPTAGKALQPHITSTTSVFVTKLSPDGSKILYSTFIGGSADDVGYGIAVDSSGSAYVTGDTSSTNFPLEKASQKTPGGLFDAFVFKLSPDGSKLLYSTYIGGSQGDRGDAIAVDGSGNAYITGYTYSTDFPILHPIQNAFTDGNVHCFVTKLDAGGALAYSTYLGGGDDRPDQATGIAVDSGGNAYVTGYTNSVKFPDVNQVQKFVGPTDVFVTKINPAGTAFVYSTHVGGNADDEGMAIAVDASGSAYVTGETESVDFPTTPGAYSTKCNPVPTPGRMRFLCVGGDVFVIKLSSDGSKLVYSTFVNGKGFEVGRGIAVDSTGAVYVTGLTTSQDFPSVNSLQPAFGGGDFDAFVFKLSPDGSSLVYSSTLGGNQNDGGYGVATDSKGNAYVTGYTYSTDFPTKNPLKNGSRSAVPAYRDVFVAKIKD